MSTDTLPSNPKLLMRSIIQRIATGPDLSKNISRTEARLGTKAIIDNVIDPIQVGIYFIALRMKRETMDENRGVLDAVLETTRRVTAEVDEVVDIGDPYDGYNRCLPAAPFLGPLLAEFGVHVVSHGLDKVGPKYGVTARHVLEAAGVPVNLTPAEAAARLNHPHLVALYKVGEDGAICFIASEYCSGPTLAQWLRTRKSPVPFDVAVQVIAALAEAVAHAHSRGVLHRDIKPSNVLLAAPGDGASDELPGAPKLTDAIWLYGGDRASIAATVTQPRNGVMPRWGARLDPVTIKMLAAYVYSLGGGEKAPAPAAEGQGADGQP